MQVGFNLWTPKSLSPSIIAIHVIIWCSVLDKIVENKTSIVIKTSVPGFVKVNLHLYEPKYCRLMNQGNYLSCLQIYCFVPCKN